MRDCPNCAWMRGLLVARSFGIPEEWNLRNMEMRIMSVLLNAKKEVSIDQMISSIYFDTEEPEYSYNSLVLTVTRMRPKLKKFNIDLVNIRGVGYYLKPSAKQIIMEWGLNYAIHDR